MSKINRQAYKIIVKDAQTQIQTTKSAVARANLLKVIVKYQGLLTGKVTNYNLPPEMWD